jgi:hypothetical protein
MLNFVNALLTALDRGSVTLRKRAMSPMISADDFTSRVVKAVGQSAHALLRCGSRHNWLARYKFSSIDGLPAVVQRCSSRVCRQNAARTISGPIARQAISRSKFDLLYFESSTLNRS